jgi:hypothetical protein
MPRIGVTGHAELSTETSRRVLDATTAALREYAGPQLHGITCLAHGADQLFAKAMLAVRGTFEVVLPARDYRERMTGGRARAAFDALLRRATKVSTMPFARSSREAYLAASTEMLDRCDLLFAIWDGQPSRNKGDTAHVVSVAQDRQMEIRVIWPDLTG